MNQQDTLSILQYNVRKSRDTVMATLLRDPRVHEYDIVAIQEPWWNPFADTTHHPAKDIFHLCYPKEEEEGPARVCFFVSRRLDHRKWKFKALTRDICSIIINQHEEGREQQRIAIHNVYNPATHTTNGKTTLLEARAALDEFLPHEQILLGDFNLHHPLWGGPDVKRIHPQSENLVAIMEDFCLSNTLPAGTITFQEAAWRSTIDLCLVTAGLVDRVIRSEVEHDLNHDSDHLPISTEIHMTIKQAQQTGKRNYKRINEENYVKALKEALPPLRRPTTKTAIDNYVQEIVRAIKGAAEKTTPQTNVTPQSREGWTDECKKVLMETKRLRRLHSQYGTEETWEAYRAARNHKTRTIRKALTKMHRHRVEEAAESPEKIWRLAKWARTRGIEAPRITPAIRHPTTLHEITEPEDKADLFRDTFFPTPPEADLRDIQDTQYNGQIALPPVTEKEVREAIRTASPLKAPGPDGIINKALQAGAELIVVHLTRIFNQSLHLGHCPAHFRKSTTVVLRKPGKDNYTVPKAYRPIALLNTIGKIMDAVIARRLSYLAETRHVLPAAHLGGRKRRTTEHALHAVTRKIQEAWNRKPSQVASLLLLDVSGAFDNVSHTRLLHNLRKRRIDETTVRWIASFLNDRHTSITIDGYQSKEYATNTGIPQGSPLSPILYLFYNADLIDECNGESNTMSTGYIDDVGILTWGKTTEETCNTLSRVLEKAQRWATTHASVFAPDKFQLTHFTRSLTRIDTKRPIQTEWGEVKPKATCKYLGLTMDTKMRWKEHIEEIRQRATKTVTALSCLGGSTWGVGLIDMRKIYKGTALPQMMYASSIWYNANTRGLTYTKRTLEILQNIQARAARAICGAYRATSNAALDIEAHLLPIEQQIWKHNANFITRLLSCKDIADTAGLCTDAVQPTVRRARRGHIDPWQMIYDDIRGRRKQRPDRQEPIPSYITQPWRQGPKTHIESSAEEAQQQHDRKVDTGESLSIYTDGSGIDGQIGAAAVCLITKQSRIAYMGPNTVSTVYAAELQGINLALQIAQEYATQRERNRSRRKIAIYTDNQSAIRSITKAEGKSGAYILNEIAQRVQQLQDIGWTVTVRWIPAHVGIPGNEAADKAAKEATGWREDGHRRPPAETPPTLYTLRPTLAKWCKRQMEQSWATTWRQETRGRASYRYTPRPTKKVLQLHEGLSKRKSALLVQLRTEKIGLNDFLFSRRVPEVASPRCGCGERRQTVAHVLLQCRTHKDLRNRIFGDLPGRNNLRIILSKQQLATKAIEFVEQTQILGQPTGIRDA
jgi:ribonuclease HI